MMNAVFGSVAVLLYLFAGGGLATRLARAGARACLLRVAFLWL